MDLDLSVDVEMARRFSGVRRLYGEPGLARLQQAHVMVIGIGGVGSWAAEALARNAVGKLTLVDLDNIAESNMNRQIHALSGNLGKAKVTAMQERIAEINPVCVVNEIEDFVTPDNLAQMLAGQPDLIVDCMDDTKAKIALAAYCKQHRLPLVMVGSAGGKLDATRLRLADLAHVQGDRMLSKVRNQLRRDHGFPKASDHKKSSKFGLIAVYSDEPVERPQEACETPQAGLTGLHCAGYGSSICVTASAGFIAAQQAIQQLLSAVASTLPT
ncbi:tRNA threonylcarbamoyladenosine dehydratase [Methylophilus sp. VKM B-3414]|uniref:tRNA threonylcarbamoyladenosine dehydratase n=1 Tax=Methylophilus sp. VKM B-3414 TaxID=3076121 RepID=UPI0028C8F2DE|nr:tRNA threonylcarbamoyladenosine dehydratase [Methylophilus sp. VKM B-3414]MDT7849822.1 tRNA threonylcarbamoyladenosine dehydratase [Methylophilus sp. VKM B-3414]